MATRSIVKEYKPTTTLQYATAIHKATCVEPCIQVKYGQLFITKTWRIRPQFLTKEQISTVNAHRGHAENHAVQLHTLRQHLLRQLAPAAQEAVRALLRYPGLLRDNQ